MVEKEHPLLRIAEALKKFAENPTQRKGVTLSPERQKARKEAAERLTKTYEKKKAEDWTQRATSKDPVVRKQAQEEVRYDKYAKNLDEARQELQSAQNGDQAKTPDWLTRDANTIRSAQVAEFTAAITRLPEDLQKEPVVLYREAAKLYRSENWKTASLAERKEARRIIDATIAKIKELAPKSSNSALFTDINARRSGDYYLNIGLSGEDSFDLYKSKSAPGKKEIENIKKTKDEKVKQRVIKQNEKNAEYNKKVDELDRILTQAQEELDIYGEGNIRQQTKILESARNTIGKKINDGIFSGEIEKTAAEYRNLADFRLKELGELEELQDKKKGLGIRYDQLRESPLTAEQVGEYVNQLPTAARSVAKEAIKLSQNEAATPDELKEVAKKLHEAASADAIEKHIKSTLGLVDNETLVKEFQERVRALKQLEDVVLSSAVRRLDYRPDRGYFGLHEEDYRFVSDVRNFELIPKLKPDGIIDVDNETTRKFIQISHKMLDRGDSNERAMFSENFDMLYDNADWKTFTGKIEDGLRSVGWTSPEISRYRAQFMAIREMRELAHNVQLVANTSGLDVLKKTVLYSVSGDFDVWFRYNKGLRYSYAMQLESLRHIMGFRKGYLLPEELAVSAATFDSRWKRMSLDLMTSARDAGLPDVAGMTDDDILRTNRVANALGIITLRTPMVMSEANIPQNFTSNEWNGLVQDVDEFRHLIFKYGIGKQGLVNFYRAITKDEKGALHMTSLTDDKAIYEMFHLAQHHPQWGQALANFRNFAMVADRMGDGKSFWGVLMATKNWSQEMKDVRGVGVKLFDAYNRALERVKLEEKINKFGSDRTKWPNQYEEFQWWTDMEHDAHVHHRVQELTREFCREAMGEALYKLPGEVIDRAGIYPGYEELPYHAIEDALRQAAPDDLNKILKNDDGSSLVIAGKEIKTLFDLYNANPAQDPEAVYKGLAHVEREKLKARLDIFNHRAHQAAMDLGMVQQFAVRDLIDKAKTGAPFQAPDEHFLDDYFGKISDEGRRNLAQAYAKAIVKVAQEKHNGRPAFFETLVERFADGREYNVFTTSDTPLDEFEFVNWGSTVPGRTVGDAESIKTGVFAVGQFFGKFEAHPEKKDMLQFIGENIKTPMSMADDRVGLNFSGFCVDNYGSLYREKDWVTWTGIPGDIITSSQAIETAEWLSDLPGVRTFTKGKIPEFMWGAMSQRFITHGADKYGADGIRDLIHEADGKNLLPKVHHPLGWGPNILPVDYTYKGMLHRHHGTISHLAAEALMTAGPIAAMLMVIQAVKEESEESKRH